MNLPARIAVIGANGFVGSRLVESWYLRTTTTVVPVVRRATSLSRSSRFELGWRIANACSEQELTSAFTGCNAVVDTTVGDPSVIKAAAKALIPAAHRAGVRRVVYLSSASVHGQNPMPGCTESTPLSDQQDIDYNNAKVHAERCLLSDSRRYGIELIILRPSIVYGPRDRWISTLARELTQGTAWLVGKGTGICNALYVDNLVHAIERALIAPSTATGEAYLLNDTGSPTWAELYEHLQQLLPSPLPPVHHISVPPTMPRSWFQRFDSIRAKASSQAVIALLPTSFKNALKGAISGINSPGKPSPWRIENPSYPHPSIERIRLQQCAWRFPIEKARAALGFDPSISLETGLTRTIAWLRWCGTLPPTESSEAQ